MMPVKLLVTGSRYIAECQAADLFKILDSLETEYGEVTYLIHGAAKGADTFASEWATMRDVAEIAFPANWKAHGKGAGPRRNIAMLDAHPDAIVVAFPVPDSIGTFHCIKEAEKRGMTVRVFPFEKISDKWPFSSQVR